MTLPYALQPANKGVQRACLESMGIASGVNIRAGQVTNQANAATFGLDCVPLV